MCLTDGILRARLDGELPQAELLAVDNHLAVCPRCRRLAEIVATTAQDTETHIQSLAPSADWSPTPAHQALARFNARSGRDEAVVSSGWKRLLPIRLRPIWGIAAVLLGVIALASIAPMGAWAERVLGLLRIQQIAVVSINPQQLRFGEEGFARQIGQLISDNVTVTKESERPLEVSSRDEASEQAGFSVRLLKGRPDVPELRVTDSQAFEINLDLPRLQGILDEAGMSGVSLPASLDGSRITVEIYRGVVAAYGRSPKTHHHDASSDPAEWAQRVVLVQIPAPTIITPPDLRLADIAVAGLQLVGMTEEEALAFSQTVDWSSTLVVPIPMDVASSEQVDVDGVKGTLIMERPVSQRPAGYTLLWVKDGIIHALSGFGNPVQGLSLADWLE